MKWRSTYLAIVLFSGCSSASHDDSLASARQTCAQGAAHTTITYSGKVQDPVVRTSVNGTHELFAVLPAHLRVAVNLNITGPLSIQNGDQITVHGQFECTDSVVHWTHHDPRGRHPAGYIQINGRLYQ